MPLTMTDDKKKKWRMVYPCATLLISDLSVSDYS